MVRQPHSVSNCLPADCSRSYQRSKALDERNIIGMLVIGSADNTGLPVRAAQVVGQHELLETEHAPAAARSS